MADIRVLDPSVYNKIAAGEVVEKPASVVKELVENALDAGATIIAVTIAGGGLEQIEVVDNGCGIPCDQLPRVFLPHATSKLATDDQLFSIATLGFRGEAMASIAAVSQVTLTSRVAGQSAYRITADGTAIGDPTPTGADFGTTVCVRNLFYHTPARLKFLRSEKSETHDITTYIQRLIVANPLVSFSYAVDGKPIYHTTGSGLEEAVNMVLGADAIDHLLPIEATEYGYSVQGFVSDTLYSVGTRSQQITVVNGRVVSNVNLNASIANVYRDYLMKRQFPVYVLHIRMPFDEVDVNVHPTKADVRFQYANKLFGFVYRTVKAALEQSMASRTLYFDTAEPTAPPEAQSMHIELAVDEASRCAMPRPSASSRPLQSAFFEESTFEQDYFAEVNQQGSAQTPQSADTDYVENVAEVDLYPSPRPTSPADEPHISTHTWRLVGQLLGTYLVVEMDDNLLLVDQHAAAERVLYDRLVAQYTAGDIPIQPMLIPYTFTLSEADADALDMRIDVLRSLGVDIVRVGQCTYELRALPALLAAMDLHSFVGLVLAEQPCSHADLFKERLAYAACRSAVKGNTYMDNEAIRYMCDALFTNGLPGQCPHGRPAYIVITRSQLEQMFRRSV